MVVHPGDHKLEILKEVGCLYSCKIILITGIFFHFKSNEMDDVSILFRYFQLVVMHGEMISGNVWLKSLDRQSET